MSADERWGRLAVGLALAGLVVAGCSDPDGNAQPTEAPTQVTGAPTPTAEPTATETPGPGPTAWPEPTRPPEMERDDVEGAKAAAEYFLELYPYVFATGDLAEWEAMSHPECQFCRVVNDEVRDLHAVGGYGLGGAVEIHDLRVLAPDAEYAHFRVGVRGAEEPSFSYTSAGDLLDSADGGAVFYTIGVMHDGTWSIRGLAMEEP